MILNRAKQIVLHKERTNQPKNLWEANAPAEATHRVRVGQLVSSNAIKENSSTGSPNNILIVVWIRQVEIFV